MKRFVLIGVCLTAMLLSLAAVLLLMRDFRHGEPAPKQEHVVEEHTEITGEIISESLRDVGELITEEYWFTQVATYDSAKSAQLFNITFDIPLTRTRFVYSYDGVIRAGVDFSQIEVEKDDLKRLITVYLPKPYIIGSEVDFDSFELYDEQSSIFNPVSVRDVNDTNKTLLRTAEKAALDKGLLERADKNAETLLKNFLRGGYGVPEYVIRVERKS